MTRLHSGLLQVLLVAYLALIPVGWSSLPWNMQWADVAFLGVVMALVIERQGRWIAAPWLDGLVLVYVLTSGLAWLMAPHGGSSAVVFAKDVYGACVYGIISAISADEAWARRIARWSAAIGAVVATVTLTVLLVHAWGGAPAWGMVDPSYIPGLGALGRGKGWLLTPALLCNYLTFALPLTMGMALAAGDRRHRRWWGIAAALIVLTACSTVTYSLVGCLAAGLFMVWRSWKSPRWLRVMRGTALGLVIVLFIGLNVLLVVSVGRVSWSVGVDPQAAPPADHYAFHDARRGAEQLTVTASYHAMSYGLLKQVAWRAFRRSPWTGVGLGGFHDETEAAYERGELHALYRRADPHSAWWGRLAETGLVGWVALLALWLGVLRVGRGLLARRGPDAWMDRAIVAGLAGLAINSLNVDIMHFRFVWIGLGLMRSRSAVHDA